MICAACEKRGKTWEGGDPICSFPNGGEFDSAGWNCATANAIRDLCGQDDPHPAADHRYCNDQHYSTIKVDRVRLLTGSALALWVSWYKHRGRTEAMWLLSENELPRRPTEADCIAVIAALSQARVKPEDVA
jgi:hypothetical protein